MLSKKQKQRRKYKNKVRKGNHEFNSICDEFININNQELEKNDKSQDVSVNNKENTSELPVVEIFELSAEEYLAEFVKLKENYDLRVKTDNKFLSYTPEYKISIFKDQIFNNIISKFSEIAWNLICNGYFIKEEAYEKIKTKILESQNAERDIKNANNNQTNINQMNNNQQEKQVNQIAAETKTTDEIIAIAEKMYKELKEVVHANKKFVEMEDKLKLDLFRKNKEYDEFMTEFPVVSRYLICMGQYKTKAFRKMLEKIKLKAAEPMQQREKGYNEDQWIRRNCDYVRYLWEAYQKTHYSQAESNFIWEDTYRKLKGEFDDFRNKYKDVEEATKKEKERFKVQNAKDLLNRLNTKTQKLNENDSNKLKKSLYDLLYRRRYTNAINDLMTKTPKIEAVCEGKGTGPEEIKRDKKNVVTMVEHIDPSRMQEIPEHLQLSEKEAQSLPGYLNEDED